MSDPSAPSSKYMEHQLIDFFDIYIFLRNAMAIFAFFPDFFMKNLYFAIFALFAALHGRPHDPSSMFLTNMPFLHILAFKQSSWLSLGSIRTFLMIEYKIYHFGPIWSPPCATP